MPEKTQIAAIEKRLEQLLPHFRWFGAKSRSVKGVSIVKLWQLPGLANGYLGVIEVRFADRLGPPREKYLIPLLFAEGDELHLLKTGTDSPGPESFYGEGVCDGLLSREYCCALLEWVLDTDRRKVRGSSLPRGFVTSFFKSRQALYLRSLRAGNLEPRLMGVEQTNTSVCYGDDLVLKLIRKVENGTNLDVEVTRFLTCTAHFRHCAQLAGTLEFRSGGKPPVALASVARFVRNRGDAWCGIREQGPDGEYAPDLGKAALLGRRTLEMHQCLASWRGENAPEKLTLAGQRALAGRMKRHALSVFEEVRHGWNEFPDSLKSGLSHLLENENRLIGRFDQLARKELGVVLTRTHGDYHMGQVLDTGRDFVILDFEGEPARSLAERRMKHCPLRDVSGVLRSIHYAVSCTVSDPDRGKEEEMRGEWIEKVSGAFLDGYFSAAGKAGAAGRRKGAFLPDDPAAVQLLLDVFVLEKALYELKYEINHRPDWVHIPLSGLLQLCSV